MQKSDSKIKFTNYEEVEIPETLKTTLGLFLFKNFLISLGLFIILFGIIFIIFSTMQFFELWAILTTIFSTMFIGIIFYILSSIKGFKDLKRKTVYLIKGTAEKISNDKGFGGRLIATASPMKGLNGKLTNLEFYYKNGFKAVSTEKHNMIEEYINQNKEIPLALNLFTDIEYIPK